MNETDVTTQIGRIYFRFWRAGLRAVLGWSDDRVGQWTEQWKARLNNEHDSLFNDTPAYLMAPLLIPDQLRRRIRDDEHMRLVKKLRDALNEPDDFPEENVNYDWASAADRVRAILREYGSDLPKT
jgi:hypothetical protein